MTNEVSAEPAGSPGTAGRAQWRAVSLRGGRPSQENTLCHSGARAIGEGGRGGEADAFPNKWGNNEVIVGQPE